MLEPTPIPLFRGHPRGNALSVQARHPVWINPKQRYVPRRRLKTKTPLCYNRPMRLHDYAPRPAHIKWLLDSDPAIRWQVMRDLTGEAPNTIAAERSRVATEGWGAQLLALQSPAGDWGGPKADLIALYTLVVLK